MTRSPTECHAPCLNVVRHISLGSPPPLRLSDSALPTGGFVASSGLESFIQHGFIATDSRGASDLKGKSSFTLLDFLSESLVSYSLLNLPFFQRAHLATWRLREAFDRREVEDDAMTVDEDGRPSKAIDTLDETVQEIVRLDAELEAMLLNHVTRRANKAQGVALLTLYTKAFGSLGSTGGSHAFNRNRDASTMSVEQTMADLIDALKTASRKPVRMQGHLPICFAVLTAALGLSLGKWTAIRLSCDVVQQADQNSLLQAAPSTSTSFYKPVPSCRLRCG